MSNKTNALIPERSEVRSRSKIREYTESIAWAILLALVIRTCVVQTFKIPSGSMENTLLIGDQLIVNKFIYGIKVPFTDLRLPNIRNPQRGDVVVFQFPKDHSKDYIKRLIGLPGDKIEIHNKQVFVNGIPYHNPHELHRDIHMLPKAQSVRDNFGPIVVPAKSFFMMGDNRDNSYDSRFWGFVRNDELVGLAFIKHWSWDEKWHPRWNRIGKLIH